MDKAPNQDVFVIDAKPGGQPRRLTNTTIEENGRLSWSPDGKWIAYQIGDELKYSAYDQARLAVIPSSGGEPRSLTDALDRPINGAMWSKDGQSLTFVVVDDRAQHIARVPAAGGKVETMVSGRQVVNGLSPWRRRQFCGAGIHGDDDAGSVRAREWEIEEADPSQRCLDGIHSDRHDRGLHVDQQ